MDRLPSYSWWGRWLRRGKVVSKDSGELYPSGKPDLSGIYRFLKAMETRRLVVSSWDTPEKGHARRLFQITAEGEACLLKWTETLEACHTTIKGLLRQVGAAASSKR